MAETWCAGHVPQSGCWLSSPWSTLFACPPLTTTALPPSQLLKYTVPHDGTVNIQACSDEFQTTLTVIGNGEDADGLPITNGTLICGYFDSCSSDNPDLFDPTSQTV